MKENQDINIDDPEQASNGFLGGKLFKFKKYHGAQRKFGDTLGNAFTSLINLEGS